MASVTGVIVSSIVPIFLIVGVGLVLNEALGVDVESLNTLTLYVLTPALVVHSITLTDLETGVLLTVSVGVIAFLACAIGVGWLVGRALGKDGAVLHSFLLIAVFGNTGALGIPLADFAFGDVGRQTAVLFAAVHGTMVFTVGLGLAAMSGTGADVGDLKRVFRYPLLYATLVAVLVRVLGLVPPADAAIMETLGLVGESAIPIMLVILGIQLSETEFTAALELTAVPSLFRFVASPLIGIGVAVALGLHHSTVAQVFVLLTAMPVAVAPVIFAVEFAPDTEVGGVSLPELVSANVLVTTLLSLPVLTVVVTLLKADVLI